MKKILMMLALVSIIVLSGCNPHTADWDRESCKMAGYEEPTNPDTNDMIRCRDECEGVEVGVHYKQFELLREGYIKEVMPTYTKDINKDLCEKEVIEETLCATDDDLINMYGSCDYIIKKLTVDLYECEEKLK